ncbi:helix-turn-helix domain-containing protein [Candidatus Methylacidithermus pantelleriae]|uniref:DNA binding HTH domain-containing protein n=1 Tax=Candidatus Methylacidithermus pantelleriae TaxID=2744239 RepID=A0A8J2FST1_9BACT|nr:helix-turn-helix domain-containing protein [Candidatus Methylacidithermus pantelleriae]CAF0700697.1 hypothetical protein MPNT_40003 [Candidatus Methylacidithermus pantelleriae]
MRVPGRSHQETIRRQKRRPIVYVITPEECPSDSQSERLNHNAIAHRVLDGNTEWEFFLQKHSGEGPLIVLCSPDSLPILLCRLACSGRLANARLFVQWLPPVQVTRTPSRRASELPNGGSREIYSPALPSVQWIEWQYIHWVLRVVGGNLTRAARCLGMHRRTLQRKLQKSPPVR